MKYKNGRNRAFEISIEGLPTARIDSETVVQVAGASNRLLAVRVRAEPDSGLAGSNRIDFVVKALDDESIVQRAKASFFLPDLFILMIATPNFTPACDEYAYQ